MDESAAQRIAEAWVTAWAGSDPGAVLDLLHHDAVITDPVAGKVRSHSVPGFVRVELTGTRPELIEWRSLAGADSVAVASVWSDGTERLDTLILADDGGVVRVMCHRHPI
ncbi:MAG: hypothetical protein ACRD0U_14030 [Acidimicrobiales bacterium]